MRDNINTMRIGTLRLASNLCLAPLAGYTNLPFRLVVRELGGLGLATTDLVNARSLLEKRAKAFKLIESCPDDQPLVIQLFGAVPEEMRDAALLVESMGAAIVEVNMGCPVRKVCQVGGGSAMMRELEKTTALIKAMVRVLRIPVTAKMRLGWDSDNITAPELAQALEAEGVAAVTIHGRTREQGFGGVVSLAGIRAVTQAVKSIPVIGNGDVTSPDAVLTMIQETGCAGVSIGRGALYDPWIFSRSVHFLQTGQLLPESSFTERVQLMRRHLDRMVEVFGESQGCRMFRKVAPWYARRFGPAREFCRRVALLSSRAELEEVLSEYFVWRRQFLEADGTLKAKFLPTPLASSFMSTDPLSTSVSLPTPKGPVDWW